MFPASVCFGSVPVLYGTERRSDRLDSISRKACIDRDLLPLGWGSRRWPLDLVGALNHCDPGFLY